MDHAAPTVVKTVTEIAKMEKVADNVAVAARVTASHVQTAKEASNAHARTAKAEKAADNADGAVLVAHVASAASQAATQTLAKSDVAPAKKAKLPRSKESPKLSKSSPVAQPLQGFSLTENVRTKN